MAVAGAGGDVGSVGVCRAGNSAEPAVEEHKVLGHGLEHGDVIRLVVVDGLRRAGLVLSAVLDGLFGDKAMVDVRVSLTAW